MSKQDAGSGAVLLKLTGSSYYINKSERLTIITYRGQQGCNSSRHLALPMYMHRILNDDTDMVWIMATQTFTLYIINEEDD